MKKRSTVLVWALGLIVIASCTSAGEGKETQVHIQEVSNKNSTDPEAIKYQEARAAYKAMLKLLISVDPEFKSLNSGEVKGQFASYEEAFHLQFVDENALNNETGYMETDKFKLKDLRKEIAHIFLETKEDILTAPTKDLIYTTYASLDDNYYNIDKAIIEKQLVLLDRLAFTLKDVRNASYGQFRLSIKVNRVYLRDIPMSEDHARRFFKTIPEKGDNQVRVKVLYDLVATKMTDTAFGTPLIKGQIKSVQFYLQDGKTKFAEITEF